MLKIGLKLWSTNKNYVQEARRIYDENFCHYVELYVVPGSYREHVDLWRKLNIPFIIHAPHFLGGMNLAKAECFSHNVELQKETVAFADVVNAKFIIFHPGVAGDIQETARQLTKLRDERTLIENKPYFSLDGEMICNGYSPEEIRRVMREADVGFCLDIGHAICAANALKNNWQEYLNRFINLRPRMFHLTDGDSGGLFDRHDHLGEGSFDLSGIVKALSADAMVTLETKKDSQSALDDFKKDVMFLKRILENV